MAHGPMPVVRSPGQEKRSSLTTTRPDVGVDAVLSADVGDAPMRQRQYTAPETSRYNAAAFRVERLMSRHLFLTSVLLASIGSVSGHAQQRNLSAADLFRLERVGTMAWSPDRRVAAIEIHRPGRWLDTTIPTADIFVLDVESGRLRQVSPSRADIVGFFAPAWSPDSRRLVFLSADNMARVHAWLWASDGAPATTLTDLEVHESTADPPLAMWRDAEHVIFLSRDAKERRAGPLYNAIFRGRNIADLWTRAHAGTDAVVTVLDSWGTAAPPPGNEPQRRIVAVDVQTRSVATIAAGALHRPRLSPDRQTLTYWSENPSVTRARVASFFRPEARGEATYDAVNWGNEIHHIDPATGSRVAAPPPAQPPDPSADQPTLRISNSPAEGTRLLLSRPGRGDVEVWRGNTWVSDIRTGRAEAISYRSSDGRSVTGWILYPPDYVAGKAIPIVTMVYPGTTYSNRVPGSLDLFNAQFNHPQMFAALGYGVVLPSMPAAEQPLQVDALRDLAGGVLPLLDVLVERGIADADRIAVVGQSAGGWATLGLITHTQRFRTAIASAGYSNLASLYGTFYGQGRYGDGGDPQRYQLLRMLQFERGYYGAGAPPWEQPDRYRTNSPIWRVANVRTPLMLVQGEQDFVPVQQGEEFFTALYRQDRRVRFVRYAGEGHTIAARANVVDLWRRIDEWLRETLAPRAGAQ